MRTAVVFALVLFAAASALAATWQSELSSQMQELHGCKVGFLAQVNERHEDGRPVVSAMVQCEDGRQFDAVRHGKRGLFTITVCEQRRVC